MATTATMPPVGLPRFELTSGGAALPPAVSADVESVQFDDELNRPAMLRFTVNLWDAARQALKEDYLDRFQLGAPVELAVGITTTSPMFAGEVVALEPSFGETDGATVQVRAYDRLHRLSFGTQHRAFENMTDSDIATAIADECGLSAQVDATTAKHTHVVQNTSNLTFLFDLARPIGYEVGVDNRALLFRRSHAPEGPIVTLTHRRNLISFNPRMRAVTAGAQVEVRGWDVKTKKPIIGTAALGDEESKMGGALTGAEWSAAAFVSARRTMAEPVLVDADEAQRMARALFNRQQDDFIEADGRCPGLPALRAGRTLEIAGLTALFNGIYYVTKSTHSVGPGGYVTSFTVRRSAA